jgi:predicted amidohydrolase YtcJ
MIARRWRVWVAALGLVMAVAAHAEARKGEPDVTPVLYHGGVVYTAAAEAPDATWFVVGDGIVLAVGDGDPPADLWPGAERVDLQGRFVAPGFVDAHIHFVDGGLSLIQTDLSEETTRAGLDAALARAREIPLAGWTLARNLDVTALGGGLPDHGTLQEALGDDPAYIALKGGHHVYVNPAGLARLDIDAATRDPDGGHIVRDAEGAPTGVLVDAAAWDALRAVYDGFGPDTIVRAMLAGQERALAYGITAMGDNTFFPDHASLYERLIDRDLWHIRVAARSYGPAVETDFLMKPMGKDAKGAAGPWFQYFGQKYFGDESLSPPALLGGDTAYAPGGEVHYTQAEFRRILLFAGGSGLAFHVQGRTSVERLIAARTGIKHRRRAKMPDILDHCGSCSGDLVGAIGEAGFRITLLPGQLHELPLLVEAYGEEHAAGMLSFAELFDSGIEPALTSDWPYGASVAYPDTDFHRMSLAPLSLAAVAVSGKTPQGEPIPHAASRLLTIGQAMQGLTRHGALAIGRTDVGRIAVGARADFVVLDASPFDVDPVDLYTQEVQATYVDGLQVFPAPAAATVSGEVRGLHAPVFGWTPSPIIGYSPTHEFILGGALFFYPYKARGTFFSMQIMGMTRHPGLHAEVSLRGNRVAPKLSLATSLEFDNWRDNDFGVGIDAEVDDLLATEPLRVEAGGDVILHPVDDLEIQLGGRYAWFQDGVEVAILARSRDAQPRVTGHHAGARAAVLHDGRDAMFSPRRGAMHQAYVEVWPLQASEAAPRVRIGADLRRFIPLRAPDLVLALRLSGGAGFGEAAYYTNYSLGGIDRLRGYYSFRFRGHHFTAAAAELRFPIWFFISGVLFGEAGRVWVDDLDTRRPMATTAGVGLRIGLPPDFVKKLRFDVGFSPDQWGIFFAFDEAF